MHSKYDNMYKNVMFYALICIYNHIIVCINCMLSLGTKLHHMWKGQRDKLMNKRRVVELVLNVNLWHH